MNISALIENKKDEHVIVLSTDGREQSLTIQPKLDGFGSSANGGELLFLALATCYCNDLYREARERGIAIERVQVEVTGEFGAEGTAARNISYRASVDAKAAREEIIDLMRHTDSLAEIQNTLRCSSQIMLAYCEAREIQGPA
jgi:organic hydroperoxide reductase OsmC/OhrA